MGFGGFGVLKARGFRLGRASAGVCGLGQGLKSLTPGGPAYPEAGLSIPRRVYMSRGGPIYPDAGLSVPQWAHPSQGGPVYLYIPRQVCESRSGPSHPGGNPGGNPKSISHRCYLREVAFEWDLTEETIFLPLGCLQGGGAPALSGGRCWLGGPRCMPPRRSPAGSSVQGSGYRVQGSGSGSRLKADDISRLRLTTMI